MKCEDEIIIKAGLEAANHMISTGNVSDNLLDTFQAALDLMNCSNEEGQTTDRFAERNKKDMT